DGDTPVQVVASAVPLPFAVHDLRNLPERVREAEMAHRRVTCASDPFDLERPPLWRAVLLQLDEQESRLLLTLHHIIADGWSIGVLVRDLAAFYDALSRRVDP